MGLSRKLVAINGFSNYPITLVVGMYAIAGVKRSFEDCLIIFRAQRFREIKDRVEQLISLFAKP